MIKKIGLTILVLLIVSALGGYFYLKNAFKPPLNLTTVSGDSGSIDIHWSQNSYSDRAGILIPVYHKNIKDTLWMQFDLGAVSSLLYKTPLEVLKLNHTDNLKDSLKNFELSLGLTKVFFDSIPIIEYGRKPSPGKKTIIGTLGNDFLEKTKALINFKDSKINFYETLPDSIFKRQKSNFSFNNRRIFIDVKMNGKPKTFMWDTGSSAYDLITSKNEFQKLKIPSSKIIEENVNQVNRKLKVYTAPADLNLNIANNTIPLHSVTYVDGFPWYVKAMFSFSGMEGMLGNNLFKEHSIYLDCEKNELIIY